MFANLFLGFIAKKLDGYKMYIAGAGLILMGIVQIIGHYWPDTGLPANEPSKALDQIALGLGTIGAGHKMDKLIGGQKDCE